MALLDMFDKLDDIIYKPIESVCEWIKEPLKVREFNREQQAAQNKADLEAKAKRLEAEIALWDDQRRADLENARAKAEIELHNLAADSQLQRNTAMVEAIEKYQLDLARVTQEIITSIGTMNLELRAKANDMLLSKMRDYKALQDEAIETADNRLVEIKNRYSDNERVRIKMEDSVISQMESIITHANRFMDELSEDLRKINDTIQQLTEDSVSNVYRITGAMPAPTEIAGHLNDKYMLEKS